MSSEIIYKGLECELQGMYIATKVKQTVWGIRCS